MQPEPSGAELVCVRWSHVPVFRAGLVAGVLRARERLWSLNVVAAVSMLRPSRRGIKASPRLTYCRCVFKSTHAVRGRELTKAAGPRDVARPRRQVRDEVAGYLGAEGPASWTKLLAEIGAAGAESS